MSLDARHEQASPNPTLPGRSSARVARRDSVDLVTLEAEEGVERTGPGMAPTAFRIWNFGVNMTDKGPTIFSERSAALLMAEQELRGNLYSVDVDHLSLSPSAPIECRRAVGWHRLGVREGDGLWAVACEWTDTVRCGLEMHPPEWRYFSPAYDLDPATNEVVSYLNTALTNNPATWSVTALATRKAETGAIMLSKKDMVAALEHMAKGEMDAQAMASFASAMLSMIGSGAVKTADDPPPEHAEPDGDEGEAPAKEPDGDGDEQEASKATRASASNEKLLAAVESLTERLAKRDAEAVARAAAERRATVIAARRWPAELRTWAEDAETSLAEVERVASRLPLAQVPNLATPMTVTATRGVGQGDTGPRLSSNEKLDLDRAMGLAPRADAIRHENNVSTFGVMTPAEAASRLAARNGGVK